MQAGTRVVTEDNETGIVLSVRIGTLTGNVYYRVQWDCGGETEVLEHQIKAVCQ
jgi:hypothetical protein